MNGELGILASILGNFAALASVIVAVLALAASLETNKKQSIQSMTVAKAQVKPYLSYYSSNIGGDDRYVLKNSGLGTAIITKVTYFKNGIDMHKSCAMDLFDSESSREFASTFQSLGSKQPVMPGQELDLAKLSEKELKEQGHSESEIKQIVQTFQDEARKISIDIEYEDVLGNSQDKACGVMQLTP